MHSALAWLHSLASESRTAVFGLLMLATTVVAFLDFLTAETLSLYILFAPVVALAGWLFGVGVGTGFALVSSLVTVLDDYAGETPPAAVQFWAAAVRFAVFACFAWTVARLRRSWKDWKEQRRLASHDALTGLANRQHLFARGAQELAQARREGTTLGTLFIDCDHFKAINDRWGHSTGDELLCDVADAIRSIFDEAYLAARLGGDEFVVLGRAVNSVQLRQNAERLQEEFARRMAARGCALTLSIGAAWFARTPSTLDEVIAVADELMYLVKHDRRNGIEFREFDAAISASSGGLQPP